MRATSRPRAASDPGPLPEDEVDRLDLPADPEDMPLLSPTSFFMDLETREPSWSPGRILNSFQEDGQFMTDPLRTRMIGPEPEQMHDEVCEPMFCYPDPSCFPPPALPMEPINEVASESQPFISNTVFGYDPNTPFPVPGPTHFIMERVFNRMYVDDSTYPGFTVLVDDDEQEQNEDDEYVIFGLNDPSEHTDFGRAMAAKHSGPRLNSVYNFQEGPAIFDDGGWDLEAQQYQYQDHEYFCESTEPETHDIQYFDCLPAIVSDLNPEAPDSTQAAESSLNPEAPVFNTEVNDVTPPGVVTPTPRLRLAMRPLMMRAKRLSIREEDMNLGRISWVDRSSWFTDSDTE